ncbi:MAG: hypothetical protein ACRCZ2_08745 [Fusobacteriaceae bacterium]
MAKKWSEVVSSEGFISLNPEEQAQAQRQYFDTVVAPKAQERGVDLAEVENQFFTTNPLQGTQNEQTPEDVVLPEPPQDLTGQTTVSKPVESQHWAPIPSSERQGSSNWADTALPSNVKAGYRGDGSINYDDPRWRGKNAYGIASETAWDDTKDTVKAAWDDFTSIPTSFDEEPDAYTKQVKDNRSDFMRQGAGLGSITRPKTQKEMDDFNKMSVSDEYLEELPLRSDEDHTWRVMKLMEENPEMPYEEAYNKAFLQQGRSLIQAGAATAATLATGGLSLPIRMGAAGLAEALSGQAVDVAGGENFDTGEFLSEGAWGSIGGVVGGKAGKGVVKGALGKEGKDLISEAAPAVAKMDDLAKQAQVKQSTYASTYKKMEDDLVDLEGSLKYAKKATPTKAVKKDIREIEAKINKVKASNSMTQVLDGTKTITANDVVQGRAVMETLSELANTGGKVQVKDALSSIKNKELRAMLEQATPLKTKMNVVRDKVEDVVGEKAVALLGMEDLGVGLGSTRKAITKSMDGLADELAWSKDSIGSAFGYKGSVKDSFDSAYSALDKAQKHLENGKWQEATNVLNKNFKDPAKFDNLLGATAGTEIQRMKQKLLTIAEVGKTTKGATGPAANILGTLQGIGVPTLLSAIHNPAMAATIQGGKMAAQAVGNKINIGKVKELEKALGGKLRVDAKAEKMLEEGQDIGSVIGYLVAQALKDE